MKIALSFFFMIYSVNIFAQKIHRSTPFTLYFKLLNKRIEPYQKFDEADPPIYGIFKITNLTGYPIHLVNKLGPGWKGNFEPLYLEAYTLDSKERDITFMNGGGDYIPVLNPMTFEKNATFTDTFNIRILFRFRAQGIYKIRLVYEPQYFYDEKNLMKGVKVYSNWDTLYVRN